MFVIKEVILAVLVVFAIHAEAKLELGIIQFGLAADRAPMDGGRAALNLLFEPGCSSWLRGVPPPQAGPKENKII